MIQTLGDVLVLVTIIGVGVVSFLLAVLLYHLIFVVMDLREVMRKVRELTEQIEEALLLPIALIAEVIDWIQRKVWDVYFGEEGKRQRKERRKKRRARKRGGKG